MNRLFPKSIRWKLWIGAVALAALPLLLLNQQTIVSFDTFSRTTQQRHMANYAAVIGTQYARYLNSPSKSRPTAKHALAKQVRDLGASTDARMRIYDRHGEIIIDTHPTAPLPAEVAEMPAEVTHALEGGWDARSRLTKDKSRYYYFLAQPIKDEGKHVLGVSYVIKHTAPITAMIRNTVLRNRWALAIALVAATTASLLLGWAVTRRLRTLTHALRRYARGDGRLDLAIKGRDEIAELGRSLKQMARDLDERYIYNHDFVRTLFHEIKNPIHAIQGALEHLQGDRKQPLKAADRDALIQAIKTEADRVEKLVQDLQQQTQLDADRMLGGRESVSVHELLTHTVERWQRSQTRHAPVTLRPPAEPLQINVVRFRIEQVLTNLLDNAARHTPLNGQIEIRASRLRKAWVRLEVEDNGEGIPASALERVFDRFYSAPGLNGEKGSGLGLDIAKLLVQQHGGRITVDSIEGEGTTFYIDLPGATSHE